MLKTLSADAELGCTKRTFFTTEDQLGRFASFLNHHCSFSSSVCKSAPSATAKYLGSSAVSPCMMASLSRKRNLLNSSTEADVGRSCWTSTQSGTMEGTNVLIKLLAKLSLEKMQPRIDSCFGFGHQLIVNRQVPTAWRRATPSTLG